MLSRPLRFLAFCSSVFMVAQNSWAFLVVVPESAKKNLVTPPSATCRLTITHYSHDEAGNLLASSGGCSGTLIKKNTILTAAHCIDRFTNAIDDSIIVECPNEKKTLYGVLATTPIPYQNAGSDFALIRLSENTSKTEPMQVVIASSEAERALKRDCYVAGYGLDKDGKSGKLIAAKVTEPEFASTSMGWIIGNIGTEVWVDHGDSGGTLYCKLPNGRFGLVGVTSMTADLGKAGSEAGTKHLSIFAPTTTLSWALEHLDGVFWKEDLTLRGAAENWMLQFKKSNSRVLKGISAALSGNKTKIEIPVNGGRVEMEMPPLFKMLSLPKSDNDYRVRNLPVEKAWAFGLGSKILVTFSDQFDKALTKK